MQLRCNASGDLSELQDFLLGYFFLIPGNDLSIHEDRASWYL